MTAAKRPAGMPRATKADLLNGAPLPRGEVETSRGTVEVRGLNRLEAGQVNARSDDTSRDRLICALGMVDPEMTEQEVGEWFGKDLAGNAVKVALKISELSGLLVDSGKAAYKSV